MTMAPHSQHRSSDDEVDAVATGADDGGPVVLLSKRQRQKKLSKNDKNRWLVQHPKIHNMDVRERVQIKDAGLKVTKSEQTAVSSSSSSNKKSKGSSGGVDPQLDMINSPEIKFGRLLGGTDQRRRHAAVRKLKLWLKARCDPGVQIQNSNAGISEIDLLKLWKALWFTLYMADKVPVQDELSKQLVSLIWCVAGTPEEDAYAAEQYVMMDDDGFEDLDHCFHHDDDDDADEHVEMEREGGGEKGGSDDDDDDDDEGPEVMFEEIENTLEGNDDEEEENEEDDDSDSDGIPSEEVAHCRGAHLVSLFIRTFFRTIRRDWHKMDKYRIDKFYTLIRHMLREMYMYLQQRQWHFGMIRMFNDVVFEEVLRETPNGLRYHLIDISLEELAKVAATAATTSTTTDDDEDAFTTDVFIDVMEPFLAMSQTGAKDDTVQERVVERILERFLEEYSVVSENALQQQQKEAEDEELKNGESVQKKNKKKEKDDSNDTATASSSSSSSSPIFRHVSVTKISQLIFGLGSDMETNDRYRKSLYDMHKKYAKRLKTVGDDIDGIVDEDDGDDVMDDANQDNTLEVSEEVVIADIEVNEDDVMVDNAEAASPKELVDDDDADKEESSIKKKKKKKKKRKSSERDDTTAEKGDDKSDEPASESITDESDNTNTKSKKKKRKKNTDNKTSPSPIQEEQQEEEVVLISLSEQRQAKKKEDERNAIASTPKQKKDEKKKKKKKKDLKEDNAKITTPGSKRVKWDKANKAISHKASMKALKTATPPPTKERTPEKSILRKSKHLQQQQYRQSVSVTNKGGRRKASEYW